MVGIVTCSALPEPDLDQEVLLQALTARDIEPRLVAWNDPEFDPGACDLCVVRSTWDYHHAADAFAAWIDRTGAASQLFNPPEILRWNLHKRYLIELEEAGVPVVPTAWAWRGEALDLQALLAERSWSDVVIKPAISGGSFETQRFQAGAPEAAPFLQRLTRKGDAMIQPFQASVDTHGERALIWIDGEFTHAIRKETRYAEDEESVSAALELTEAELSFGERVLAVVERRFGQGLLYARVDLMPSETGELRVSELELLEPSLFFLQSPAALERFADAIAARLPARRG